MKSSKSSVRLAKGNELIVKSRESSFYIPPSSGIPKYDSYLDPNCPKARVKKFNDDNKNLSKLSAMKSNESGGRGSKFITKILKSKFDDVPLRLNPSLRAKAISNVMNSDGSGAVGGAQTPAEVEILQKVIVRENILGELHKLLDNQNDVSNCINEVVELVKAIRFQTVDLVEDIDSWQCVQPTIKPFLYRGVNYLLKLSNDLDFLDKYEEIIEKFCFEFKRNPFAYRDGGNVINPYFVSANDEAGQSNTGQGNKDAKRTSKKNHKNSNAKVTEFVDGVELYRLHNGEKTIQREIERLENERKQLRHQHPGSSNLFIGEDGMNNSTVAYENSTMSISNQYVNEVDTYSQYNQLSANERTGSSEANHEEKVRATNRVWKVKFDPKKVKTERINVLSTEIDELKAMEAHIEDQISAHVHNYHSIQSKRSNADQRRIDALTARKDIAAQHIAVEISILTADMQDINTKIKELQRQSYFISLERKRKRRVVQQLTDELNDEKRRAALKTKLEKKIKENGLISALKTLNKINMEELMSTLSVSPGEAKEARVNKGLTEEEMFKTIDDLSPAKSMENTSTLSKREIAERKARGQLAMQKLDEVLYQMNNDNTVIYSAESSYLLSNGHDYCNMERVPSASYIEEDYDENHHDHFPESNFNSLSVSDDDIDVDDVGDRVVVEIEAPFVDDNDDDDGQILFISDDKKFELPLADEEIPAHITDAAATYVSNIVTDVIGSRTSSAVGGSRVSSAVGGSIVSFEEKIVSGEAEGTQSPRSANFPSKLKNTVTFASNTAV